MKYYLKIYDNFHHMDESETSEQGSYETYTEALKEAKKIIYQSMMNVWAAGMTPDQLSVQYSLYGNDPEIHPPGKGILPGFSSQDYADSIAEEICRKMELK